MHSGTVGHPMRPMTLPMSGHVPNSMPVPNTMSPDIHMRQTIDRLQCIQTHLKNPTTFIKTARELLDWCSDTRAFQPQFHQCLMNCLMVVNDVAGKPGFDVELCYKLVAQCFDQRDKFPPSSADMLLVFYNRAQKLRMLQPGSHMDFMKTNTLPLQPMPASRPMNNMMSSKIGPYPTSHMAKRPEQSPWNQQHQHPNQPSSLSVITTATVWGVSTTQTPPVSVYSQSSSTISQGHMMHHGPHVESENIHSNYNNNYPNKANPPEAFHNSAVYPSGHRGMGSGGMGPQAPMNSDQAHHTQPAAAAAAAAVAAAAAAATATATATATFRFKEQQNPMNSYEQVQGGPMGHNIMDPMGHQSMGQQHPHPGPSPHDMNPQMNRIRPPMPPQYGRVSSVPPNSFPMGSITSPRPLTHSAPPSYNNDSTFKQNVRPQQVYGQSSYINSPNMSGADNFHHTSLHRQPSGNAPTGSGFNSRLPAPSPIPSNVGQNQYFPHQPQHNSLEHYSHPQGSRTHFPPHYTNETRFPNSHTPIPGNPTPPLTPGSVHNVPPYTNMPIGSMVDGKNATGGLSDPYFPYMNNNSLPPPGADELRLTFPVRDGMVLGPFKLEHNRAVSDHAFHLRENVYKTLVERPDLDLQFKCFHHDDFMKYTNWPHSVQVGVNSRPLPVPRGDTRASHKPLYLKRVCQPGRNSIDISVSACCCSHLFVLQLVHRPSIRFVLKGLMIKRILPEIHCRTKIKRILNGTGSTNPMMPNATPNGLLDQSAKISLFCRLSGRRIQIPARGQECKHIQCFDLESYLQENSENATWKCPVCGKNAQLEYLEVDEFLQNILKATHDRGCQQVSIDSNCNWAPISCPLSLDTLSRPSTTPMGRVDQLPLGLIKQESGSFMGMNIKQEPINQPCFGARQEPSYINNMNIKKELNIQVKPDPDYPPNKRLRTVTSPNVNLYSLPAPSPGSSGIAHVPGGFPQSYDLNRFSKTPGSRTPHGSSLFRGGTGITMAAETSEQVAASDMVSIERRPNPALVGGNHAMSNGGSPKRKAGCGGNPATPQGSNTPMRPPSSSTALTPQSVGSLNNNSTTPSAGTGNASSKTTTNQCQESEGGIVTGNNPNTPVVSLHNCDDIMDEENLLESLFSDGGLGSDTPALPFDTSSTGLKNDVPVKDSATDLNDILPVDAENDLMEMLKLPDVADEGTIADDANNNATKNSAEEDILSLFDS